MSLKRGALANLSGQIAVAAIQLIVIPRYVHYVGIEAYGLVGIYVTIQAAAQLLDLGMSAAVNRQLSRAAAISEDVSRTRDFLRTSEILYVAVGLVIAGLLFALAPAIATSWISLDALPAGQVADALRLIAVLTAVQWPLTFYQGALLGLHRPGVMNLIRVSATLVSSGGALVVLARVSPTVGALFTWQIGVAVLQVCAVAICAWRAMPAGPSSRFNLRALDGVAAFALGMTAVTATATVVTQMDKVVLTHFVPLAQFGYYTLASVIGNGFSTIVGALFATMLPVFSRLAAQDDRVGLSLQYRRMWGLMAVLTVPFALVVAVFSREAMLLWTRSAETASIAAPLLALLIVGSALNGLMVVVYALQIARGDTRLVLRLNFLAGLIGLPLLLLLVPRYGTVGAAAVWPIVNACYMAVGIPATTRSFAPAAVAPWITQTVIAPAFLAGAIVLSLRFLLPRTDDPGLLLIYLAVSWALAVAAVFATNRHLREEVTAMVRFVGADDQQAAQDPGTTASSIGLADGIRRIALPPARAPLAGGRRALAGALGLAGLVPFAVLGHGSGLPGLEVRLRIAALGSRLALRRRLVRSTRLYEMFCFPMDSTRYFEFDFMWRRLKDVSHASYLDVSSPRLLPILFVDSKPDVVATFINPDAADLRETRALAEACGIAGRCRFEERVAGELSIPDKSFDVITSVSVVEHIRDDVGAVAEMWRTLRPGGRLLISMPCAANAEQQFINSHNYSFMPPEADGTVFHQYIYSTHSLQRIFAVTGPPVRQEIYGERAAGFHARLYKRKWIDVSYPFWKEPWFMTAFSRFDSIEQLPGEGVVLLEFVK